MHAASASRSRTPFPISIPGAVINRFRSYEREVVHVRGTDGDELVIKVFGTGAKKLAKGDAWELVELGQRYLDALRALGVRMDKPTVEIAQNGDPDHAILVEHSPYRGRSVGELLQEAQADSELVSLVRGVLECVRGFFGQRGDPHFPVGIDLVPRNFTRDEDGKYYCIDFHPPKLRLPNGTFTLEWPQPADPSVYAIGVYRHFHPLGLLRVLFLHLCRIRSDRYNLFRREIHRFADEVRISGDPIPEIDRECLEELGFDHVYDLRLLACQLAAEGRIMQATLDRVFDLTHFQTDPVAADHFLDACRILRG
ncbi:MAG: hypothetical protein Q7S89_00425 [bacterium]|nr:hypothetical protein [bacterium]